MLDLKGHAALVTGSSKGVGRSIAEAYARAGADVVIHARTMNEDAREVMDRCAEAGARTTTPPRPPLRTWTRWPNWQC